MMLPKALPKLPERPAIKADSPPLMSRVHNPDAKLQPDGQQERSAVSIERQVPTKDLGEYHGMPRTPDSY